MKYVAILTIMGLCPEPELTDYWKNTPGIFGNWLIKRIMLRTKFEAIHSAFHMNNEIVIRFLNTKIRSV